MARILTGIQSTGTPHLGNLLGAIIPAIALSQNVKNESLFFIADLHSFTTIRNAENLKENTYATAAAWLAFGFDTDKNLFYRQSDVTEVTELTWYLNCFTPYPMLANAHSFKDKVDKLSDVNSGLFTYPVLMAADILLYDAEIVPGTDGQKMSKSYNNDIDIFLSDNKLKKQIMGIKTDSTPMEDPKKTENCNVFKLYKLLSSDEQTAQLKSRYEAGNFGYGHAKQELFELICLNFSAEREKFNHLIENKNIIEEQLQKGAEKARVIAREVLTRIRTNIGY